MNIFLSQKIDFESLYRARKFLIVNVSTEQSGKMSAFENLMLRVISLLIFDTAQDTYTVIYWLIHSIIKFPSNVVSQNKKVFPNLSESTRVLSI